MDKVDDDETAEKAKKVIEKVEVKD